ncbi:class I SAM-dependent methyltransferase [uncultured Roseovarius sp.]|uniref:class I SAM-dependent methyltransferase n=1 Tax=uncultured Roseovarius sp. TaxID=293344 RepID=UPI00263063AC|nr:class I SAM-dependent methyltransferase [uncultured Roseovarius sp.]
MATAARLTHAIAERAVTLPGTGRIAVFAPRAETDLSALPKERVQVLTTFKPDHDHFASLGYDCAVAPEGRYAAAIVCLPRAKALTRATLALAASVTDGPVIVDGAKTDGIESILRDCRRRMTVGTPMSKAHGKVFAIEAGTDLTDWATSEPRTIEGGYMTAPGVFSADAIDPASDMLARNLPPKLGAHVVDLGAGWGYLSANALTRASIEQIDLVEADHAALACARTNVTDPRARFHWADATRWQGEARADSIIMNPPFHESRSADPDLGRGFIRAAAGMLKPSGALWMVANRHLPYETTLAECFASVSEVAGDTKFKILHATRPARQLRQNRLD